MKINVLQRNFKWMPSVHMGVFLIYQPGFMQGCDTHLMCCLRAKYVSYVIYLLYLNQLFVHIHAALGSNWSRHTDHHYQETNQCAFIDYCRAMLRGLTGNIPLAEPIRLGPFSFCGVNCQSKTRYKIHLQGFQFFKNYYYAFLFL